MLGKTGSTHSLTLLQEQIDHETNQGAGHGCDDSDSKEIQKPAHNPPAG